MTKQQDTRAWMAAATNEKILDYHRRQFKQPYRSTVGFCDWLEAEGLLGAESAQNVLDIGCGMGANSYYLANRFSSPTVGIDINPDLISLGNSMMDEQDESRCSLEIGDIYKLPNSFVNRFDGLISFQVVSWLPSFEEPVAAMARLCPSWIAMSSLFFEGEVAATVQIQDYTSPVEGKDHSASYYNVYSLTRSRRFLAELGYGDFRFQRFEIDIDLDKPKDGGMGTYTERLVNGQRLQVSGPVLMSWYFVAARRDIV
ncbi:hypothetical protein N825_00975 [Skermanella stibiiresistens SB22]|uniref:Methyltransferase domain-containing protein n=1 Tax=Skermanella stibiiresistens SB22 TaxID=1385369 RepID=W9H975_9PROT|nr:class I SAM-dependent methyltransferase [Skermanella stibiiresistens]EWY42820.1 hypothetical protein N825_00975 [Skermanella stibiiresistens SB22]